MYPAVEPELAPVLYLLPAHVTDDGLVLAGVVVLVVHVALQARVGLVVLLAYLAVVLHQGFAREHLVVGGASVGT